MYYTSYAKVSADFRRIARDVLKGKWKIAVLATFLAGLLGGIKEGISFNSELSDNLRIRGLLNPELAELLFAIATGVFVFSIVYAVLQISLGGIINVGYAKFNLNLIDGKEASISNLFEYFKYWKNIVVARILTSIIVTAGTVLLIVPGIIASMSFAMVPYILAENPEIKPMDALRYSWGVMKGNRWRLFCLQFSFIGWSFLAAFTLGIGALWLTPYMTVSYTAFYREITETGFAKPPVYETTEETE